MSPYGGNYLNQLLSEKLKSKEIQVTAPCFIKKQTVEGVVANIQKIQFPNTRPSFVTYSQMVGFESGFEAEHHPGYEGMLLPPRSQTALAGVAVCDRVFV